MVDWRKLKKIDAHIHILPDAVHEANPDADDVWVHADLTQYLAKMEAFHIEKAVIMPFNDPWLMSMEFTIDAVHRNLAALKQQYPGRFFAFADVDPRNAPEESVKALGRAIDRCGLDGIKLHPTNTGISADDECNQAIYAFAQQRDLPVAIHSYPIPPMTPMPRRGFCVCWNNTQNCGSSYPIWAHSSGRRCCPHAPM